MNAERLLGMLLKSGLRGASRGKPQRRPSSWGSLLTNQMAGKLGMGAIGVAMAAYEHFTAKGSTSPNSAPPLTGMTGSTAPPTRPGARPSAPPPPPPPPPGGAESGDSILLIRAMVAAANADGVIDADERTAILDMVRKGGLDATDVAFVQGLLDQPPTVDSVIMVAKTDELRRQIYAVSLMAIEVDTELEQQYIQQLRQRLGLTEQTVRELHEQLGMEV